MSIELIRDKDPGSLWVDVDRLRDVVDEVSFRSPLRHRRGHDLARDDVEIRHQTEGAMPQVLELDSFDEARPRWLRRAKSFQSLHAALFVCRDDVRAFSGEIPCVQVDVTNPLNSGIVRLWILALVLRCQPVL